MTQVSHVFVLCVLILTTTTSVVQSWDYSPPLPDIKSPVHLSPERDDIGGTQGARLAAVKKSLLDRFPWLSNQHLKRQQMQYQQCYFNPISCF